MSLKLRHESTVQLSDSVIVRKFEKLPLQPWGLLAEIQSLGPSSLQFSVVNDQCFNSIQLRNLSRSMNFIFALRVSKRYSDKSDKKFKNTQRRPAADQM